MLRQQAEERDEPRLLDEQVAKQVIDTVKAFCGPEGELQIMVESMWCRGQRWARNRASLTSDQRDVLVLLARRFRGARVGVRLNQIDTASLRGAVDLVDYYVAQQKTNQEEDLMLEIPRWETKGANVWSDLTFARSADENGRVVHTITERAEANGFLSAGYIETIGANVVTYTRDPWGREKDKNGRVTGVQCSMTVRHPKGTGSGWAGNSSFDLTRIDIDAIASLAFDKCQKSLNPVRIEPGRYQTILEPQAVQEFASVFIHAIDRWRNEHRAERPFWMNYDPTVERGRSKLGLRIMDQRLTISHDPEDPLVGTVPQEGVGPVQIVQSGELSTLFYDYQWASRELSLQDSKPVRSSFIMRGSETTSVEEMISTVKRGLLVTRVSRPEELDPTSLLCTGVTRDGLWLIENGKITKAVRNFRWTESPLFIFNNVEQIGESVPVFTPTQSRFRFGANRFQDAITSVVVPALKINDFSFTSTIDAV